MAAPSDALARVAGGTLTGADDGTPRSSLAADTSRSSAEPAGAPCGVVTLLTDFGTKDPFVGVMKAVMLGIARELRFVDFTHALAPGDVDGAGFWLEKSFAYAPRGSVHLAVVDPGVGTARRALLLEASGHYFVGPDNGLFGRVLRAAFARSDEVMAHSLDAAALRARLGLTTPPSRTFHGRDVFAPAAALVASGTSPDELGARLDTDELVLLPPESGPRVVVVDRFGNLITDAPIGPDDAPRVEIAGRRLRWVRTYGEAAPGECVALCGSFGTLEIAVRDGSAQALLRVGAGEPVTLRL
jgi:S-adenosylmethionine hydrolase